MTQTSAFHTDLLALDEHPVKRRTVKKMRRAPRKVTSGPRQAVVWDADSSSLITVEFTDAAVDLMDRHRDHLQARADQHKTQHGEDTELQEVLLTEIVEAQLAADDAGKPSPWPVTQRVLDEPQIGRNDPCHCGSGKKYKRCHA